MDEVQPTVPSRQGGQSALLHRPVAELCVNARPKENACPDFGLASSAGTDWTAITHTGPTACQFQHPGATPMPLLDNDLLSLGFKYRSLADASPGVHTGGPFVLVEQDEGNRTGPMGRVTSSTLREYMISTPITKYGVHSSQPIPQVEAFRSYEACQGLSTTTLGKGPPWSEAAPQSTP